MSKPRMTNDHKVWVRDELIYILSNTKYPMMSHDEAVAAVTTGSTPMYVDVCRRMVKNCPFYAKNHKMETQEDWFTELSKAFGEWILYKAGVRMDESTEPQTEEEPKTETKEADDAVPST